VRSLRFGLLAMAAATPAAAQQLQFSAIAQGDLGYRTNPFIRGGVTAGSGFFSGSFAPTLVYQTERSTTTFLGSYSRDQYFRTFGYTDSAMASLKRVDLLSAYLTSTLTGSFTSSNNASIQDPTAIDNEPLNIGRRTYHANGQYQLQWQASAKDQFAYGAQVDHTSYGDSNKTGTTALTASSYTQYAVNVGYNRLVDARTTIGAQVSVSAVRSKLYPDSRTVQPSLTARRQLTAIWEVDGHVGLVVQHIMGPLARTTTSIGYGLNLCGTYPRTKFCVSGEHTKSPSGYGALRTNTNAKLTLTHDFTEHSHGTLMGTYFKMSSDQAILGRVGVSGDATAFLASARYDRDLTQRLSAGFGGGYQWRKTVLLGTGHSLSGSVHLKAKLGRL